MAKIEPQMLTVGEAAELAHVSREQVREWVRNDQIVNIKLADNTCRIPLHAFLASLTTILDLEGGPER